MLLFGREKNADIKLKHPLVSQQHAELRLRCGGKTCDGTLGALRLVLRDLSMNGCGVQTPCGKALARIPKEEDVELNVGAKVVMPFRTGLKPKKEVEDARLSFVLGIAPADQPPGSYDKGDRKLKDRMEKKAAKAETAEKGEKAEKAPKNAATAAAAAAAAANDDQDTEPSSPREEEEAAGVLSSCKKRLAPSIEELQELATIAAPDAGEGAVQQPSHMQRPQHQQQPPHSKRPRMTAKAEVQPQPQPQQEQQKRHRQGQQQQQPAAVNDDTAAAPGAPTPPPTAAPTLSAPRALAPKVAAAAPLPSKEDASGERDGRVSSRSPTPLLHRQSSRAPGAAPASTPSQPLEPRRPLPRPVRPALPRPSAALAPRPEPAAAASLAPSGGGAAAAAESRAQDKVNMGSLAKGEALVREGREAEEKGLYDKAWDAYNKGLREVLKALRKLPGDDPRLVEIRQMVTEYLERAEVVKKKSSNPNQDMSA